MTGDDSAPDGRSGDSRATYDAAEELLIRRQFREAASARCPRDGDTMTVRNIGGGSFGLGYARRREWLLCPTCRRSVIFDRERGTRT
jgi:hypothetical protein